MKSFASSLRLDAAGRESPDPPRCESDYRVAEIEEELAEAIGQVRRTIADTLPLLPPRQREELERASHRLFAASLRQIAARFTARGAAGALLAEGDPLWQE